MSEYKVQISIETSVRKIFQRSSFFSLPTQDNIEKLLHIT